MSVFVLKLIAVFSMLVDHSAWVFFLQKLIPYETYELMRAVGRIAFPIFCFLIVNGFDKSRDRRRYLSRLALFAVISRIPYSIVFAQKNFTAPLDESVNSLGLAMEPLPLALVILFVCAVWFFFVKRDASVVTVFLFLALGMTEWTFNGVSMLNSHLNVFYTLTFGLAAMCMLEQIWRRKDKAYVCVLCAAALAVSVFFYGKYGDYGFYGLALLLALYLLRGRAPLQALAIVLWCGYTYLIRAYQPIFAVGAALSVLPIFLYNGKLGPKLKWVFYVFYPLHLAVLAALIFI